MRREELAPAIAGGYVTRYTLDLPEKSFEAEIEVVTAGVTSHHDLNFTGLSEFAFRDEKVNRWERIEVTDIRIEAGPEASEREEWSVWVNLWDVAELLIRSAAVQVDGEGLR